MSLSVDRKTGPLIHFNKAIEDGYGGAKKKGACKQAPFFNHRG